MVEVDERLIQHLRWLRDNGIEPVVCGSSAAELIGLDAAGNSVRPRLSPWAVTLMIRTEDAEALEALLQTRMAGVADALQVPIEADGDDCYPLYLKVEEPDWTRPEDGLTFDLLALRTSPNGSSGYLCAGTRPPEGSVVLYYHYGHPTAEDLDWPSFEEITARATSVALASDVVVRVEGLSDVIAETQIAAQRMASRWPDVAADYHALVGSLEAMRSQVDGAGPALE